MIQNNKKLFIIIGILGFIIIILVVLNSILTRPSSEVSHDDPNDPNQYVSSQAKVEEYRQTLINSDPVFKILPYDSNPGRPYAFRIFAIAPESGDSKITLSIIVRTCEQPARQNLQSAALTWLQEQGISPNNYILAYDQTCN
ncbi:hypothetical protein IJI17_01505 [Candidatus Saccharibacteria bacterium]|nr:hypothetical protein [Candidatus Saccharibacteria bacterium]